jgi:hypothetical protein
MVHEDLSGRRLSRVPSQKIDSVAIDIAVTDHQRSSRNARARSRIDDCSTSGWQRWHAHRASGRPSQRMIWRLGRLRRAHSRMSSRGRAGSQGAREMLLTRIGEGAATALWSQEKPKELPIPGDPFEFVPSSVLKLQAASIDKLANGRRDQNLTGLGESHDPSRSVDGHAPDITLHEFDLPGVNSCAESEVQHSDGPIHRGRGAHRALGAVEKSDDAVAGRLYEPAVMTVDDPLGFLVVATDHVAPSTRAVRHGERSRVDNVGEDDRHE